MATTWAAGKPQNIMLATDLTPASDRAFDRAIQLAAEWDAMLTVCHVVEASSLRPWGFERRINFAETEIERRLRGSEGVLKGKISRHIILGDPAERVIEHARAIASDFLITGPAHVKVIGDKLFGSTAARILRHARQSLLAVRRREEGPYRKVVVAVDFSAASRDAYLYARALFPCAEFTLIHAYDVSPDWRGRNATGSTEIVEAEENARVIREAQHALRSFTDDETDPYEGVIARGTPEAVLVGYFDEHWPDLVVTGTHGQTGVQGALIGSVTERFLHVLPCDILAVRPMGVAVVDTVSDQ
jgi:nucleotide-binding universal stress UspA family protein